MKDGESKPGHWFERLAGNPYIRSVILADSQGRILRSTRPLRSDQETIASMFQAFDVLAQALAQELDAGAPQFIQLMMKDAHLLLFPLLKSAYFLMIEVERTAPLLLLLIEMERVTAEVNPADMDLMQQETRFFAEDDLDAAALIDAVEAWLKNRPSGSGL